MSIALESRAGWLVWKQDDDEPAMGKSLSFVEEIHGLHGFSDCSYCFKIDMDIGARSLSFSDYLVMDFGIHILFENVYGKRMTDLCIFEVLCE
jgi:hypothetical protein